MNLFGRSEIYTSVDAITRENVVRVLTKALAIHSKNSHEIDYLYRYMRGDQPVLYRKKTVRPEICAKIVENHAVEIAEFTSGYFLGEPVTYVRRGDVEGTSEDVTVLNDYMFYEDKPSHDKDLSMWMAICGVGYRMVLPDRYSMDDPDDSPFEIDTPDPRTTFVVYHSGFGKRRMMGVRQIWREVGEDHMVIVNCGYTDTHYFEVQDGVLMKWEAHPLGDIPIFEYRLNMSMMGSFEPALGLLNAINDVASNRMDGIDTFVQSLMKFKNCEVDEEAIKNLSRLGAIMIKSTDGQDGDVELMTQELNQTQTQTFVDYLYQQVLAICGLPTNRNKNGGGENVTGEGVVLRDGWATCETRARDTELLFKKSEKQFLRLVLKIVRDTRQIELKLSEIECKFTRRQHDNLLTKTQSLLHMLEAGLNPEVAIATCGLFNDPMDVAAQSKDYLQKWEYRDPLEELNEDPFGEQVPANEVNTNGDEEAEETV